MAEGDARVELLKWSCDSLSALVRERLATIDLLEKKAAQAFTIAAAAAMVGTKVTTTANCIVQTFAIIAGGALVGCAITTAGAILVARCTGVNPEAFAAADFDPKADPGLWWCHIRTHLIDVERGVRNASEAKSAWTKWAQSCALGALLATAVMVSVDFFSRSPGGLPR